MLSFLKELHQIVDRYHPHIPTLIWLAWLLGLWVLKTAFLKDSLEGKKVLNVLCDQSSEQKWNRGWFQRGAEMPEAPPVQMRAQDRARLSQRCSRPLGPAHSRLLPWPIGHLRPGIPWCAAGWLSSWVTIFSSNQTLDIGSLRLWVQSLF